MAENDYTGKTLDGKYQINRLLGEGGMGAVYLGQHVAIGKEVAVKFLHAELAVREEVVKRFFREAQAAAAIQHRNIIDVMDLGVSEEGEPYLVMEYLQGEGLGDLLERTGPIDLATTCGILEAALVALDAAHEKGIVHRDLKPDNIFLVYHKGEAAGVKLIDFGISKFVDYSDQTKLTQDGSMLGTPAYMSPEQARGLADVDHRTDLYSVGVIMYEMLTGDLPYAGTNYNELLANMLTSDPRPAREVNAEVPESALPVLDSALAKDVGERYQTAAEMLKAVRALAPVSERLNKLTLFTESLKTDSATGDLGKSQIEVGDTQMAQEVLSQMIQERSTGDTPRASSGWQLTIRRGLEPFRELGRRIRDTRYFPVVWRPVARVSGVIRKHRVLQGLTGILGIALVALIAVGMCSGPDEEGVMITVRGAPEGAKIYYEDSLVPMNPFRVKQGDTLVPIRVESPKGKVFKISIIPESDQVVNVKKQLVKPAETVGDPKQAKTEDSKSKKESTDTPEKTADTPDDKKVEKTDKVDKDEKTQKQRRRSKWRPPWRRRK